MGTNFQITTSMVFFLCCSVATSQVIERKDWSLEQAIEHAQEYNAPETWNMEMLKLEIADYNDYPNYDFPVMMSPFPTPKYSSPGNGSRSLRLTINGKDIIGHTVLIGRGSYSEILFEKADDKFVNWFTILSLDDQEGDSNPLAVSSRNHPNYFAQGSLNTGGKNRVDWIAMQMADGSAYAVVNGKIFDLRVGRLIFAAPKEDGSIRFYQTNEQIMRPEDLDAYLIHIKDNQFVIDFFSETGNI